MFENLQAQLSSKTLGLLIFGGWIVWIGARAEQFDAKLLADFSMNHLEKLTLADCGTLTYRTGEVFPSLCMKLLTPADRETVQQHSGHYTNYRGAGQFVFVDDRYIKYRCYKVACRAEESYPDQSISNNWSLSRQCWVSRLDERPMPRLPDPAPEKSDVALRQSMPTSSMPVFHSAPTVDTVQPLGQLTSTNC